MIPITFIEFCIHSHNYLRGLHGVPPLRSHEALQKSAEQWAHYLAHDVHKIRHSQGKEVYTENIHKYIGASRDCGILDAVQSW